jgi:hypothetical protein
MEDGVTIAHCLRRAGKANVKEGLQVYERIRYPKFYPFLVGKMLTTDMNVWRRYRRWEKVRAINGIKRTGTPS